jgi:hypothetical protein
MRLFTFSSNSAEARRGWSAMLCAGFIWLGGVLLYEGYLRDQGHLPSIIDSSQLWAQERSRTDGSDAVVFIGASRTLYGVDLRTVREVIPGSKPVMLALNGAYPMATLKALADDTAFSGTLLVDVDARGLSESNWDAQSAKNHYFEQDWTPNWAVHRRLLNALQRHWVFLTPRLGALPVLKSVITDAPAPFLAHDTLSAQREGFLNFDRVSATGLSEMFRVGLVEELALHPPPSADNWLRALAPVKQWVQQIEARGGRVIFFVPPVSGHQATLAEAAYPFARYWQRFIAEYDLVGWHYRESDIFTALELPDNSHVDARQKAEYTRLLLMELKGRGLL